MSIRFKIWIKPQLSPIIDKSPDRTRTYHSLPQDQALSGASVDLQFDGLRRVMGTRTENNFTLDASTTNNTPPVRVKRRRKAKLPSWENGFRKSNVSIIVEVSCILVG